LGRKKISIDSTHVKPHLPSITVANIIKPCVPYGGYDKNSINNSVYISFGDYKKIEGTEDYEIDIYSGDTKNRIFTYNSLHIPYSS
jgi:hypothetical protein